MLDNISNSTYKFTVLWVCMLHVKTIHTYNMEKVAGFSEYKCKEY